MVQFVGVPCSFLFGAAADRIGPKPSLFVALFVYTVVSVIGYFMTTEWQFFALAFLVGMVQGASQALSRSLFARMIPKVKSSEYFGFFSVFEKFAGIFGLTVFGDRLPLIGWAGMAQIIVSGIAATVLRTRAVPHAPAEEH